jgi:hypothetical protein
MLWAVILVAIGLVALVTGMVGLLVVQGRRKSEDLTVRFRYFALGGVLVGLIGLGIFAATGGFAGR